MCVAILRVIGRQLPAQLRRVGCGAGRGEVRPCWLLAGQRRGDPASGTVDHTLRVRRRMRIRGHPRAHTCRRARQKVAVGGGVAYGCLVTAMRVAGGSRVGNAVAGERRGFACQAGKRVRVDGLRIIGRKLPAQLGRVGCRCRITRTLKRSSCSPSGRRATSVVVNVASLSVIGRQLPAESRGIVCLRVQPEVGCSCWVYTCELVRTLRSIPCVQIPCVCCSVN